MTSITKHYNTSVFPYLFGIALLTLAVIVSLSHASFSHFDSGTYFAIAFVLLDFIIINIFLGSYHSLELTHNRMIGRNIWGTELNTLYYADISHVTSKRYRRDVKMGRTGVPINQGFHKDLVIHLKNGEEVTIESAIIDEVDELAEALSYYIEQQQE